MRTKSLIHCSLFTVYCLLVALCPLCHAGVTERISVASDGTQENDFSSGPSLSGDGRYVAFESFASNLVPGDTNGKFDVFVRDRQTGMTTRISVASDGTQGNSDSYDPSISADGRYVAFESRASNLVSGDGNAHSDVFVRDQETGQTVRVSVASGGTEANGPSYDPSISGDGRYVAFWSFATTLVPGDGNGWADVFVRDRQTGQTSLVSVSSDGTQGNNQSYGPFISADGRYVAFWSPASNLVSGDTNGKYDVFLRDRQTGETTMASVASDGTQGNSDSQYPSLSADGSCIAFYSSASNLVPGDTNGKGDVFVRDRQTGEIERVSVASDGTQGNGGSTYPSVSLDARYVAFSSGASNLVPSDTNGCGDIFIHDRQTGQINRVSTASDGMEGNNSSSAPLLSMDGRYVVFESQASNLVLGDTNATYDVFVRDRWGVKDAKAVGDGQGVVLSGNTVTRLFSGAFYAEDANRASGIKVAWSGEVTGGDRYRVDGTLDTDENGERFIQASNVRRIDTLPVAPVSMINRSLGGTDSDYDAGTGSGQQGIAGSRGLNNIGLYVNAFGRVTFADAGNGYFYLDDGSALDDDSGHLGVKTLGTVPVEEGQEPVGKYVKVTGISSCYKVGDDLLRLIRSTEVSIIPE